jgi:hypothetical protein
MSYFSTLLVWGASWPTGLPRRGVCGGPCTWLLVKYTEAVLKFHRQISRNHFVSSAWPHHPRYRPMKCWRTCRDYNNSCSLSLPVFVCLSVKCVVLPSWTGCNFVSICVIIRHLDYSLQAVFFIFNTYKMRLQLAIAWNGLSGRGSVSP